MKYRLRGTVRERTGRLGRLLTYRITGGVAAGVVVLVGLAMLLLAIAVGDCSFAGGRCPADPVSCGTTTCPRGRDRSRWSLPPRCWRDVRTGGARNALRQLRPSSLLPGGRLIAESARTGF
jgi:hypothetical protein